MSDRLRSMRRIVAVQAQRKRLAEWGLAAAEARKAAVVAARAELGSFVEAENLTGPLAGLAIAQTQRLAAREAAADQELARERQAVQAAERRHRLAERITEAVAVENGRTVERRSLEQLIGNVVARAAQAEPE